jgi:polyphenol oxidase
LLQQAIGAKPAFLTQVHGVDVANLSAATAQGTTADACVTGHVGIACTIMVADCLPVLFANRRGDVVAAAHAGWRGLAGVAGSGVLEAVFRQFRALALVNHAKSAIKNEANDSADDVIAWLGPCIGAQKFEVGDEVRDAFVSHAPLAAAAFKPRAQNKWLADLQGLARLRLQALGITQIYGNDGSEDWCTVSNPSRFFSHRRDSLALGSSGRMAACVWLD